MPYIESHERHIIDGFVEHFLNFDPHASAGTLNYFVSKLLHEWILRQDGLRYGNINTVVGVLGCAKLEFYRMVAAPYEQDKCDITGSVSKLDDDSI